MAKLLPEEVSLIEVAEIAKDPTHRTATTPFKKGPGNQRYVGDAVPWKMNPGAMPTGVRSGLSKAIGISQGCRGVLGVATNPLTGGRVPAKVICQLRKVGKIK